MYLKDEDLNGYMNKWMDECMDTCMGRWMNGWMCERGKSLRKSIKSSGEQLWHLHLSLLLPSTIPLPGAHTIIQYSRLTWVLVKWFRRVSWGWQGLINHSQAPDPLGADLLWWRLQDWGFRHATLLNASQAPPPGFWQRGLPTNHLALSSQH